MYTLHMFEDIKKRISVMPAFYVSFMYLLLCVYDNGSTGLQNAIYSNILYILYAHLAESHRNAHFRKCVQISALTINVLS